MSEQPPAPANWYPDPYGRHQLRYYDGARWTEHVASNGVQAVDPPAPAGPLPTVERAPDRVRDDVTRAGTAGVAAFTGGGSIFTEPVLVVSQKAKLIELNNEYAIFDQGGTQLASVREVGQSSVKKAVRYAVQIHHPLDEPLRSLVVAAALSVDTALKQDSRGLG